MREYDKIETKEKVKKVLKDSDSIGKAYSKGSKFSQAKKFKGIGFKI